MDIEASVRYDGRNVWYGKGTINGEGRIFWTSKGGIGEDSANNNFTTIGELYRMLRQKAENHKPSKVKITMEYHG